jgi:2-methylcitrate dehydratase PrpD
LLAAVVAGYEATMRLGRAIGGALLLYRGVWPTYATAAFGSAAAAARLLGLDAERTAQALALALARSGGLPAGSSGQFGFRYFALGAAVADGCAAALAAVAGVRAEADDLAAFAARIGAQLVETELTDGLGQQWRLGEVETKMLPSARQALASVEAFMSLAVPADAIERIVVAVPPAYRAMVDRPQLPARRIDSLLSVQYQIALAALDRGALYDALREPVRCDASIAALMARIELRSDDGLGAQFPRHWGSAVQVRLRSGAEARGAVLDPPDARDASWDALQRKLERIFAASGLGWTRTLDALHTECRSFGDSGGAGAAARLVGVVDAWVARPVTAAGKAAGAP